MIFVTEFLASVWLDLDLFAIFEQTESLAALILGGALELNVIAHVLLVRFILHIRFKRTEYAWYSCN